MASYETLLVERRGRVALTTINRPAKLNALNIQTRAEGAAALDDRSERLAEPGVRQPEVDEARPRDLRPFDRRQRRGRRGELLAQLPR